jgi:hypothetical protein
MNISSLYHSHLDVLHLPGRSLPNNYFTQELTLEAVLAANPAWKYRKTRDKTAIVCKVSRFT